MEDSNQRIADRFSSKTVSIKAHKKNDTRQKDLVGITYAELVTKLKAEGKLWDDPDFPADSKSVFISDQSDNYREFEWKRPREMSSNPDFISGGFTRFDVQRGALGDSCLLAVVASLSVHSSIFNNVVPDDQDFDKNYIGAFRFMFWRFGKWCEVIVDDRIPTFRGKFVFMHSSQLNEFWPALLEKAYAKMVGTYESLNVGSQGEAMEDFTGGLCETIRLNQKDRPLDLFMEMQRFVSQSSLIGCIIESPKTNGVLMNGLITSHAYIVTGVTRTTKTNGKSVELVRVRNPWAMEKGWKGRWSENASEWITIPKEEKKRIFSDLYNDGEFWMSIDDFADNFTQLNVCHLGPESSDNDFDGKIRWQMSLETNSWLKNVNAGGCRNFLDTFITNPQYRVEITIPDDGDVDGLGTLIVGLMQKDMRKRNQDFFLIGYVIYKLKDPKCGILNKSFFKFTTTVTKSPNFVNQREICGRHRLPVGHYVIIPSTFNPNEETDFILRIFTEKPNIIKTLDVSNGRVGLAKHLETLANNITVKRLEHELEQLFRRISGPREIINVNQLKDILNVVLKKDMKFFEGFSFETCRSMIALYDDNQTGKMEFSEFLALYRNIRIWKSSFKDFDRDDSGMFGVSEFRNALNTCGLNVSNSLFKVLANRYSHPENGVITFEDFIMAVIRLTNAFITIELQPQDARQRLTFTDDDFMASLLYM